MTKTLSSNETPLPPIRTVAERVKKYVCTAEGPFVYTNVVNKNTKLKAAIVRGKYRIYNGMHA